MNGNRFKGNSGEQVHSLETIGDGCRLTENFKSEGSNIILITNGEGLLLETNDRCTRNSNGLLVITGVDNTSVNQTSRKSRSNTTVLGSDTGTSNGCHRYIDSQRNLVRATLPGIDGLGNNYK